MDDLVKPTRMEDVEWVLGAKGGCMEDNPMMQAEQMPLLNRNKQGQRNFLDEMLRTLDLDAMDFAGKEDMLQALLQRARELQDSEKRLRIMADYTYDWEYWLLPDGRLEYCSPSCKRITGYDVQEFLADPGLLDRIVHPEDARVWQEHCQAVNKEPEHLHAIFRIIHRSGEEFWISHHCLAIFAGDGQYLGRRASNRNISARKQAEARLRKKNEELELYFTSSLDLLCIANVDGRFVRLNPEWERVLGYSVSDLEDRMFLDFVHPEDVQSTLAAVSRLENQEEVLNYVNRYRCKDGTYRWIEWRSRPVGRQIFAAARDITERKLAEAKLQDSEENLARTLQSIGDGVISTDREGRVARMNPVAEKLCGWEDSEAKGRFLGEVFCIVNAITRETSQDPVKKVFETGRVVGLANHTLLLSKDGAECQIADSAAPIKDRAGNITGAVLVFRDVTQEYAREKAIREEREQLLSVFNSIDGMIYISDPETYEILYVNNKLADLLPGDCIGSKCYKTLQGLEAPCGFCTNHIILGNTEPYRWDYYNPSLDRHFSIVDRIIQWSDGRDVRFEMAIDITERKRAEEDAEKSRNLLQSVLDTIPVRVFWKDLNLRYLGCNMPFARDAGNDSPSELIGKDDFAMGWIDQAENYRNDDWTVIESGMPKLNFEETQTTPDGRTIYLRTSKIPLRNLQGHIIGVLGTYEDITEWRMSEEEREKLQSQLLQVQKMDSLGTLAGGVAHDFNNLLQAMSGNIELLLNSSSADHEDTVRLNTVAKSIHRAAGLVKQLLLFGRKAESTEVPVNMNQEVEEAVRILERTIPKMIALELNLYQALWPLFADPVQVQQVLLNLAMNAVDAMPDGGRLAIDTSNVVLDENFVRTHPGSTPGRHILLSVTDTGCGMDKDTLAYIFDPFFTTKGVGKGTGLGLPSVYGIVKNHGGHIQCYSEPGLGTVFKIYLPAVEQADVAMSMPHSEATPLGGNETILVVDDEADIRELTREALEGFGYVALNAASGEEALQVYQDQGQDVDLVLLDLNMPGMGGQKCLQRLLALDPTVKVIISSGYTAHRQGKEHESSGAKGFIGKPYQLRELAAKVRAVLDEQEGKKKD